MALSISLCTDNIADDEMSNHDSGDVSSSSDEQDQSIAKGGVTTPFPWKLHIMLDHMESNGEKSVVCWQPHGRAFTVHKPKEFVTLVMPQFFNQTKYASFQRQLNLYGFSRLTHGPDKGAYYHSCFVRGQRNLCRRMIRQKIKGTKVRKTLSPEEEPNFYTMSGTLPTIPFEETCSDEVSKEQSRPEAPKEVTPVAFKSIKRSLARLSSSVTKKKSVFARETRPSSISYVMQSLPIQPLQAYRTVSPHHSTNTMDEINQEIQQLPLAPQNARGGDLLFFEGQPFRYLEHIEDLPPKQSSVLGHLSLSENPSPSSSLQDVITSVVHLESNCRRPGGIPQNICSV